MARNQFVIQMKAAKDKAYADGVVDGITMGLQLCTIALNHSFGFGEERIERLEAKVNELLRDIVDTNDPDLTRQHIETAIRQIRGKDFEIKRI